MRLKRSIISGELTPNTWILVDNIPFQIIRVNDKTVVIEDNEGEKRISKDDVKNSIIKYTTQDGKRVFNVLYSDYRIANNIEPESFVDGYTTMLKTKAKIGMTVRIDCLSTVDKYGLISKQDRIGVLSNRDKGFFIVDMNKQGLGRIKLHRTKFVLVNEKDSKIFYKLNCPCYA